MRGARGPWRILRRSAALLPAALALATGVRAEDAGEQRSRVEAAFLRNFARYVGWPATVFTGERAPWAVCIVGEDPFGAALEQTFEGRTEQGRGFAVQRNVPLDQLPRCQIAYLADDSPRQRQLALQALKRLPVLTVGRAPEFLAEGGIVRLAAGERIQMSINLDQARAVSLAIPTKMLEVAHEVVDNGAARRWR